MQLKAYYLHFLSREVGWSCKFSTNASKICVACIVIKLQQYGTITTTTSTKLQQQRTKCTKSNKNKKTANIKKTTTKIKKQQLHCCCHAQKIPRNYVATFIDMTFPSKAINITAHDLNRACQARRRRRRSHQKPDNQAKTLARPGSLKFSSLNTMDVATAANTAARSPFRARAAQNGQGA